MCYLNQLLGDQDVPKTSLVDYNGNPVASGFTDLESLWATRRELANRRYKKWSEKFKTTICEKYYYGDHWNTVDLNEYRAYVTNEIFAAIQVKLPSLLFSKPIFNVKPKPGDVNINLEAASKRAMLSQHTLNYFAAEEKTGLGTAVETTVIDAHFRFGIVEVGYSADWIDNPDAGQPVLRSDRENTYSSEPEIVYEPPKLPKNERIYVKNIPAENFRVGGIESSESLSRCSWCGYWEWYRLDDIIAHYKLKNVGWYNRSGDYDDSLYDEDVLEDEVKESQDRSKLVRVWKIWDRDEKVKLTILDSTGEIIRKQKFKRLPLIDLRFHRRLKSWFPIPPVFNWLSPQDEMNETREAARAHRRRYVRKYIYDRAAFDDENELDKLQNGGDGVFAASDKSLGTPPVIALPNADLGAHHSEMLQVSRVDFDNIAGVTPEQRGQAQSTTATQANLIDARSNIRETKDQYIVAQFLNRIGREILEQVREKLTNSLIIPVYTQSSPDLSPIGEFQLDEVTWEEIKTDALGDEDVSVDVSVESLSPVTQQNQKEAFLAFLAVMAEYEPLALSPRLVRTVANNFNFTDEEAIQEYQKMAILAYTAKKNELILQNALLENQVAQLNAQNAAAGQQQGNQIAQRTLAQQTPNDQEQIRNQISNQSTGNVVQ